MKAKCIRGYGHELTVGEIYTVQEGSDPFFLWVTCDSGHKIEWIKDRFEIIKANPEKRNNLIAELKQVEKSKINK